jgi:hypothetical protein
VRIVSTTRPGAISTVWSRSQSTIGGAKMSAPARSPSHHVAQMPANEAHAACPVTASESVPMVAPTVVAAAAKPPKRNMSLTRSKQAAPRAKRCTSHAAASASSVLPTAMPTEAITDPEVVTFTSRAPTKIAGHARKPSRTRTAIAMPVGGQTAVALEWIAAKVRPMRPAAK